MFGCGPHRFGCPEEQGGPKSHAQHKTYGGSVLIPGSPLNRGDFLIAVSCNFRFRFCYPNVCSSSLPPGQGLLRSPARGRAALPEGRPGPARISCLRGRRGSGAQGRPPGRRRSNATSLSRVAGRQPVTIAFGLRACRGCGRPGWFGEGIPALPGLGKEAQAGTFGELSEQSCGCWITPTRTGRSWPKSGPDTTAASPTSPACCATASRSRCSGSATAAPRTPSASRSTHPPATVTKTLSCSPGCPSAAARSTRHCLHRPPHRTRTRTRTLTPRRTYRVTHLRQPPPPVSMIGFPCTLPIAAVRFRWAGRYHRCSPALICTWDPRRGGTAPAAATGSAHEGQPRAPHRRRALVPASAAYR